MIEEFQVNYDDQVDDSAYKTVEAINKLVKNYPFWFKIETDNQPHDGFEILKVELVEDRR